VGETGQFELFFNGKSFLGPSDGKFFSIEQVKEKIFADAMQLFPQN